MEQTSRGEVLALFPSIVARKSWDNASEHNLKMKELFYKLEKEFPMINKELTDADMSDNYYTSYNVPMEKPVIAHDEMQPFREFLIESIGNISSFMKFNQEYPFKIADLWFAINRKNSYHEVHTHSHNIWSGVYYVQADENDAPLKFFSPSTFENQWASYVVTDHNEFTAPQAVFKPKSGDLYIFPSYLAHSVAQQKADKDRICISFNIF